MRLRTAAILGALAAGLLATGAGAVLGAGNHAGWTVAAVDAGLRLYARALEFAQGASLGFLLPVIAMTVSFHAGSRAMRRVAHRSESRVVAIARPATFRLAILFGLAAIISLVYAAMQSLR